MNLALRGVRLLLKRTLQYARLYPFFPRLRFSPFRPLSTYNKYTRRQKKKKVT
jgi:hypothetical protein